MGNSKINKTSESFNLFKRDLTDIDTSLVKFFENIVLPKLSYGDYQISIPVMCAESERWSQIQKNDFLRDKSNQILCPLMAFKRTSLAKDDTIPTGEMRNASGPIITKVVKTELSDKNRYRKISDLYDEDIPQYKIINTVLPDYVNLTYEIIVWADYTKHMNDIISAINYYSGNFWGVGKVRFRVEIKDFSNVSEVTLDKDRFLKWSCTVNIRTYILPEISTSFPQITTDYTNRKINITEKIIK